MDKVMQYYRSFRMQVMQYYRSFRMEEGNIGYSPDGQPDWWSAIKLAFRIVFGGFAIAWLFLILGMVLAGGNVRQAEMAVVGTALILYMLLNWIYPDDIFVFPAILALITAASASFAALASDLNVHISIFSQILYVSLLTSLPTLFAVWFAMQIIKYVVKAFSTPASETVEAVPEEQPA